MKSWFASAVTTIGLVLVASLSAQAQASRTWVSGVGDDANPCSRTAPCKTFAGAISKTAAAGEINCIDPGGFGAVTITKSISIICDNTEAGVLVSGTNAIIVNGAGAIVTLKGLDIEGLGTSLVGIDFIQGAALHVHKVQVRGFRSGAASGILFAPSAGASKLVVSDSYITDNGVPGIGGGIVLKPTGTGAINAVINNTKVENNSTGVLADGSVSTGSAVNFTVRDSISVENSNDGILATTLAGHTAVFGAVVDSSSASNAGTGVKANGPGALVHVSNSSITRNVTGVDSVSSGQVRSYVNNVVIDNVGGETFFGNDLPR
jgi:hypothetical protein